ncbi:DNA repair protein xrcc3 [Podila clonocystis]|nr:DNA repair protein xrcc3 [Podila clonocystis]
MTSINELELPRSVKDKLVAASLDTVEDLMLYVPPGALDNTGRRFKRHQPFKGSSNLDRLKNLTADEISAAYNRAAEFIFQSKVAYGTALDLLHEEAWLSIGDPVLDQALGGSGIMTRGITEIAGESAVGKTQMCLQLCLMVQLPKECGGLDGSVVWLSTEGKFPYSRLESLLGHFVARFENIVPDLNVDDIRTNIYYESMADQETQLHIFNYQLPNLIRDLHLMHEQEQVQESDEELERSKKKPIKLVIIDSITNNFRSELAVPTGDFGAGRTGFRASLLQRSADICEIGLRLRTLADEYGLAVVCVNQVSDVFKPQFMPSYGGLSRHGVPKPGEQKKPALGLVWENTINTRIMLQRTRVPERGDGLAIESEPQRSMSVIFSPFAWAANDTAEEKPHEDGYCAYKINETGVVGIPLDEI